MRHVAGLISILGLFQQLSPIAVADQPPADTGVLDVTLPSEAMIAINGTNCGAERHFEMKPLEAKWLYPYEVEVRFRNGATEGVVERGLDRAPDPGASRLLAPGACATNRPQESSVLGGVQPQGPAGIDRLLGFYRNPLGRGDRA